MPRVTLALLCLLAAPAPGSAAVLVLANGTGQELAFWFKGDGEAKLEKLAAGESRAFRGAASADVTYSTGTEDTAVRLEAYSAYVFVRKKGVTSLQGIELPGKAPPVKPAPTGEPVTIPVKLVVDDTERRQRPVWEAALRKRFDAAAAVVTAHTGVRFEVAAVDDWVAGPAADLKGLLAQFERGVDPKPARLAVLFTGRTFAPKAGVPEYGFAAGGPGLHSHVLIRSTEPRSEPERVEVLAAQLGRFLGAVGCPEPASVMRPRLGDGQAVAARFRIGFDPLNTLAMNIWAEHLTDPRVRSAAALPDEAQVRLARIYAVLNEALPDEPLPDAYAALLDRAGLKAVAAAPAVPRPGEVIPKPAAPGRVLSPKEDAIRAVVKGIVAAAEANPKVRGDERTGLLVKAAAAAAQPADIDLRVPAFLVGLGIALDDSTVLRDNPVTQAVCRAVESDEERRQRLAVLGNPTVRFRRDLCQHFVVSAALTELAGPALAEQVGLAKELLDMSKASGFSFSDLAADYAGVEFARRLQRHPDGLPAVAAGFRVADHVPSVDGLADGLSAEKFKAGYGGVADERFKAAVDGIRKRVRELPANGK